jgi:hypothetical protein
MTVSPASAATSYTAVAKTQAATAARQSRQNPSNVDLATTGPRANPVDTINLSTDAVALMKESDAKHLEAKRETDERDRNRDEDKKSRTDKGGSNDGNPRTAEKHKPGKSLDLHV